MNKYKYIFFFVSLLVGLPQTPVHAADNSSSGCGDACTVTAIGFYHIVASSIAGLGVCYLGGCFAAEYHKSQQFNMSMFAIGGGALIGLGGGLGYYFANKSDGFSETLVYVHLGTVAAGAVAGYFLGKVFIKPSPKVSWNFGIRQSRGLTVGRHAADELMVFQVSFKI